MCEPGLESRLNGPIVPLQSEQSQIPVLGEFMCPGADKHCSVVGLKASGWSHIECWWYLLLERDPGLKGRICLTFYLKFISLYPSCCIRIFLHWLSHTWVIKRPPHLRYKTWKYDRDKRVVGWCCVSPGEAASNSRGGDGGFCRISRSALDGDEQRDYPSKKDYLGRSKYSCSQSKKKQKQKTVGPGCGT